MTTQHSLKKWPRCNQHQTDRIDRIGVTATRFKLKMGRLMRANSWLSKSGLQCRESDTKIAPVSVRSRCQQLLQGSLMFVSLQLIVNCQDGRRTIAQMMHRVKVVGSNLGVTSIVTHEVFVKVTRALETLRFIEVVSWRTNFYLKYWLYRALLTQQ